MFQLSFFGWIALCLAVFLIPLVISVLLEQMGLQGVSILLLVAGLILVTVSLFLLSVYMNAASVVFFNVAIDAYEQQYPDYSAFVPPHIPQPGNGFSGGGPVDRYAGSGRGFPAAPPPPAREPDPGQTEVGPAGDISGTSRGGSADPFEAYSAGPQEAEPEEHGAEGGVETEPPASTADGEPAPEKVEAEVLEPSDARCDVILVSPGVGRVLVTMLLSELTGMEHEKARQLVESAPKAVCIGISREEAHEIAKRLTEAGAQVEIR